MRFRPALSTIALLCLPAFSPRLAAQETPVFRRGDSNADQDVDVSDSIHVLGFLFGGAPATLPCPDASDANDSGQLDISDAIAILSFLFSGGQLPQPGLICGLDPTSDSLGCEAVLACAVSAREPWRGKKSLEDDGFTCVPQIGGENICAKCDAQGHCEVWKCNQAGQCIEILPASQQVDPLWTEDFVLHAPTKMVGDVDGDGNDDVIAFLRGSGPVATRRSVFVALSNGRDAFGPPAEWHNFFALADADCKVGDVDGDGRQDIVAVDGEGRPKVALSDGGRFGGAVVRVVDFWQFGTSFELGDVDGDGRDDLVLFTKDTRSGSPAGDVWVALSNGRNFRDPTRWYPTFALNGEPCRVGDITGDGKDDIVAFGADGSVKVSRSSGMSFLPTQEFHATFAAGTIQQELADRDLDGIADVMGILADGSVTFGISDGTRIAFFESASELFCDNRARCQVGDPNGDVSPDLIDFVSFTTGDRTAGDVLVSLSRFPEVFDPAPGPNPDSNPLPRLPGGPLVGPVDPSN